MTVCEIYAKDNNLKPLTKKELKRGKNKVKIYGTKDLMPWADVYVRIQGGNTFEQINTAYGNIRKIVLFAIIDEIDFNQAVSDTVDEHISHERKMMQIDKINPKAAMTIKEMANEYAPDLGMKVAKLSMSMVNKAQDILNEDGCSSNDLKNVATAIQTMTDTMELTQRHTTVGGNVLGTIQVEGFSFIEDKKPMDIIEGEVDNG